MTVGEAAEICSNFRTRHQTDICICEWIVMAIEKETVPAIHPDQLELPF